MLRGVLRQAQTRAPFLSRAMSFTPPYTYIDADTLAEKLRQNNSGSQGIAVVDVRGTSP